VAAADLGLTRTHGFFMIMGGYHYYEGSDKAGDLNSPVHPLTWRDVILMLRNKQINHISKRAIQDQSKSDWFAKTIVLLQTLWFAAQCIARHIEHLPTTELEIVTLAYATINFGLFLAWWDKPRNVEYSIPVFQKPIEADHESVESWFEKALQVIVGGQDSWVDLHHERKVPVFYSGKPYGWHLIFANGLTLTAGVVFGAVHCIAWSFDFATPIQVLLWRLSAVSITAIPVLLMIIVAFRWLGDFLDSWVTNLLYLVTSLAFVPLCLLYITARFITVVLAFINLSSLPPGAFETVHWTTLIPHL
jgi:hypothetical protein